MLKTDVNFLLCKGCLKPFFRKDNNDKEMESLPSMVVVVLVYPQLHLQAEYWLHKSDPPTILTGHSRRYTSIFFPETPPQPSEQLTRGKLSHSLIHQLFLR